MTGKSLHRCFSPALLCFFAALFAFDPLQAQVAEVPYMTGRITDNAEILSPENREHLTAIIKAHEAATTDQIAILTVPSFEGMPEEFSAQVFQSWKLGEKGKNNGVLLLISPESRRIRIEVGSGLKGKIPDDLAARIIRNLIAPQFQEGDYNRGVDAAVHAIIGNLEGNEPQEAVAQTESPAGKESFFKGPDLSIPERILIGAFIFGIIGVFTLIAIVTPGVGWFLYLFLIPFWAMFPIVVLGVRGAFILFILYLAGFPVAKIMLARVGWYQRAKTGLQSKGVARIGGFTPGGGGSSSTWSSS
jgi:uncharacterized protein